MTDSKKLHYDVVIVGGGPAGIAAACTAAESGCSVGLFELTNNLGGQIWKSAEQNQQPMGGGGWVRRIENSKVKIYTQAAVFAASGMDTILVETPDNVLQVKYSKLILAVGAREIFVPFPGWTLPGVFGIGGMHNLAKLGMDVKNKKVVLAGSGPLLFAAAAHLRLHGAKVKLIAEQADLPNLIKFGIKLPKLAPSKIVQAAIYQSILLGIPYKTHCWPIEANGIDKIESVTLTNGTKTWTEPCNYLASAFGLCSNLELPELLGCEIQQEKVVTDNTGKTSVENIYCAGEPTGISGVDGALVEGLIAGYACTGNHKSAKRYQKKKTKTILFGKALDFHFALRNELKELVRPDTIICRCEDAAYKDIKNNTLWREAKLYSHLGMGPCQGRTCSGAVRYLFGWEKTTNRAPIFPVRVESLAGYSETCCDKASTELY